MKKVKPVFKLSAELLFLIFFFPPYVFAETDDHQTFHYVALGDSLAAGLSSDNTIVKGYPVYIHEGMEALPSTTVIFENAGVPGYTTENILTDLSQNKEGIRESLANANLITIDIGANDLLRVVDGIGMNHLEDMQQVANDAVQKIFRNIEAILAEMKNIKPDAQIYVMGYYNAMPLLGVGWRQSSEDLLQHFNSGIEAAATEMGATFVPTFDLFEGKYEDYLPARDNIHPNESGYAVIADRFLEMIAENW